MVYTHIPGRVCAHWSVANRVLGELQLAFVLFAVGHAFDAFDAWKNLVILFTSCDAALRTHPALFSAFAGASSSVRAPAPSGCSQRRATALAPHRHLPEPTDASAWRAFPGHACQRQCRSWDDTGTVAPQRLQPLMLRAATLIVFFFLFWSLGVLAPRARAGRAQGRGGGRVHPRCGRGGQVFGHHPHGTRWQRWERSRRSQSGRRRGRGRRARGGRVVV